MTFMIWMYDISADLQKFYDDHVRLGVDRRKDLANKRDLNLERLYGGLDDLQAETGLARPHPYTWYNQGSYAMHTLNQDPAGDNDFDIDVGLIFNKEDLPSDPLAARQRMADALSKRCTNFTQEPTAKKNAVRVAYADGYHIDFAVYRTHTDILGIKHTEHASTTWKPRDPMAINTWFTKCVNDKSPKALPVLGYYPKVKEGQFRRIVRFLKWFARSRPSWSLPGGLIISALVAEVYVSDDDRDDWALFETINALAVRLNSNTQVFNPVSGTEFTESDEIHNQVKRLKTQVNMAVSKLSPLFNQAGCTHAKARSAWDWVFNHPFWADQQKVVKAAFEDAGQALALPYYLKIKCELASKQGGATYRAYPSGSGVLQKNVHLKFSITETNVPQPYLINWEVKNSGDEASEEDALSHATGPGSDNVHWTSTAYKGNHQMICKIIRDGKVLAQAIHIVRIAPGKWWRR
ncbi:hypothetical protein SFHH103_04021 (plasmid) [Sinorhizobium fredii HH103]|uniref:Cyclic GMP-AMP synthase n=1 Tax=Sinorhizobium fredii (strain HH103) TaxID=1117943 RepID=G9ABT3_SINF1|nr:hypothetical protein [Sinorhizobium fredii]CCE98512.1 hypothetical protein SFHH103_04021 [Sinorhizobium fredii HH103]